MIGMTLEKEYDVSSPMLLAAREVIGDVFTDS